MSTIIPPRGIGPIGDPSEMDVLFGRGGYTNTHRGNVRMRTLVEEVREHYFDEAATNIDKMLLVYQIRNRIRQEGGRFLKMDGDSWWDVGDEAARRKISKVFRDLSSSRKQPQKALSRSHASSSAAVPSSSSAPPRFSQQQSQALAPSQPDVHPSRFTAADLNSSVSQFSSVQQDRHSSVPLLTATSSTSSVLREMALTPLSQLFQQQDQALATPCRPDMEPTAYRQTPVSTAQQHRQSSRLSMQRPALTCQMSLASQLAAHHASSRNQQQQSLSRPIATPSAVPSPSGVTGALPVGTLTPLSQLFQQQDQDITSNTAAPSAVHGSSGAPQETTPTPFSHQLFHRDQDMTSKPFEHPATSTTAGVNLPISHASSLQNRHTSALSLESMQGPITSRMARRQEPLHLRPTASELDGGGASRQLQDTITSQMAAAPLSSSFAASHVPVSASSQTPLSGRFYPNHLGPAHQLTLQLSGLLDQMQNLDSQATGLFPPSDPLVSAAALAPHAAGASIQAVASHLLFLQRASGASSVPQHPASAQAIARYDELRKVWQPPHPCSGSATTIAQGDDETQLNTGVDQNSTTTMAEENNGIFLNTNCESQLTNSFDRNPAASSSIETQGENPSKATTYALQAHVAGEEPSSTAADAKTNGTNQFGTSSKEIRDENPSKPRCVQQPSITVQEGTLTMAMSAKRRATNSKRNSASFEESKGEIESKAPGVFSSTTAVSENHVPPFTAAVGNQSAELDEMAASFLLSTLREEDLDATFYTPEQEQREQQEMTEEDRVEVLADLFGDLCEIEPRRKKVARREKESFCQSDLVSCAIQSLVSEMRLEIERTPMGNKAALVEAKSKCSPEEFSDERLELFLGCENLVPEDAAKRFISYWTKRHKYFGPDKFYLPITISGALRGDEVALMVGLFSMLAPDASGRPVILYEPLRHTRDGYTLDSLLRAAWYVFEAVARCPNATKGVVVVMNAKNLTLWAYDRQLERGHMDISQSMPFHFCCMHCTGMSTPLVKILKPVTLCFFDKRERARMVIHDTWGDELIEKLASYGISKDVLPVHIGGSRQHNHVKWLEQRAKEGK